MEIFNILSSLSSTILFVSIVLDIFLGYIVFRSNMRSATNIIFVILTILISTWMAVFFLSLRPFTEAISLQLVRMSIFVTVPMNSVFILLAYTFPFEKLRIPKIKIIYLTIATIIVGYITLSPYTFTSLSFVNNFPTPIPGKGMMLFTIFILATNALTLYEMARRYRKADGEVKTQIGFLFISTLTFLLLMFGLVLVPTMAFQNVTLIPLAPIYTLIFVATTTYATFRHHLFSVKVIATQAFVMILSLVFFTRIFGSSTISERVIDSLIFTSTVGFGILLVRSVAQEIKAREEIRKLADELAATNVQLEVSNERLRILDQRKSEFVSIASHQLRTPVTAIKGYTSLLLEDAYGPLSEKIKDPIGKIFHSSERLVLMINDFLNVSKIEQNSMTYTFVPLDLKKMVTELVEDFHVVAGEKKIDLATDIPDGENFYVVADEGKIRQIMSNLIDNSIKYTQQGSVRLILSKEPTKGDHGMIHLQIKDTGIGLSQDDIHHLFGKFTRGAEGSKVNTTGSGLGLYVAKQMMEKHQGNIWVDSEGKGKGSVFSIELPEFHGELPK